MDQIYISKVVAGDSNAFEYLVNKYKDAMLAAAFRIVKDKSLAEDILQDAFFNAYKNLANFKGDAKFSSWLYRIVINESIKKIRKGWHLKTNETDEYGDEFYEESTKELDLLKKDEQVFYIDETLKKMNSREALVLQFYYLEEMSLSEVTEILELKTDHVKVILHRARKQFYLILKEELQHEVRFII